jgi:hypothetical protein
MVRPNSNPSRRQFLQTTVTAAAGAAALTAAPHIITAAKTDKPLVVGDGEHKFEVVHNFPQLPSEFTWQTTHNVAVDAAGNLYVIHEGRANQPEHPSIFVFDADGKYIRSFGKQFQGGGHGIEVRKEGDEEFLYVAAYQQVKAIAKLTPTGETVWEKYAPMQSGKYAANEDTQRAATWGKDRFLPTNFAFLDDGGFLLADGYGSYYIHRYDKNGEWVSCFGGPGNGEGTFNTPHGIWIDRRNSDAPAIVICDRAHGTLQTFDMDGKYQRTVKGFGMPANIDTWNDLLVVPELHARVTLLDKDYNVVAQLGEDVARITAPNGGGIRNDENQWNGGKFVHPHDACFAADGSIYVAEWVQSGRVSKLKRLS